MISLTILFIVLSPFYSDVEDEIQPIDATARTGTSRTLVVSEAHPDGDETSPPQQDAEHPTPVASPRASSPKRARVERAKEPLLLAGSSTTPSLDDVSFSLFFFRTFQHLSTPLCFLCKSCRTFPSYIDFSFSFAFTSACDEGVYSPRYPIRRVP